MSINQYHNDIADFVRDNNLSEQQEEQLNSIISRTYVAGSVDGVLDLVMPEYNIENTVNNNERIQQLNEQEYSQFYRWLTEENIVEEYRHYAYDITEDLICNLVFGDDVGISLIQEDIANNIINNYFEQE